MKPNIENHPLFSIIIPCFNRTLFLYEAVQSVLTQTLQSFEVIVIDDGSAKEHRVKMLEICANNHHVHYIGLKQNMGVSHARNVGLNSAVGSFILFLDDDDTLNKTLLEKTMVFSTIISLQTLL